MSTMPFIAITGGIGSGKSYVCHELERHGIRVYDCDAAAKRLMAEDTALQEALTRLVGEGLFISGKLQKRRLAAYILQSEAHKEQVNDTVHPAVARDFMQSGLQWLESAILFDSGFYRRAPFSFVVGVSAPLEVRVSRIMLRDNISREMALQWIGRQWPQEQVMQRCDFVVVNDGQQPLAPQVSRLLEAVTSI